jgi:hypothetical protein
LVPLFKKSIAYLNEIGHSLFNSIKLTLIRENPNQVPTGPEKPKGITLPAKAEVERSLLDTIVNLKNASSIQELQAIKLIFNNPLTNGTKNFRLKAKLVF